VAKKGYGPIFVAGDSDGDYDMLRDFPDTELGFIVNRLKKGKIGELSKRAADELQKDTPRFLLQGRDEHTGNWIPVESTLRTVYEIISRFGRVWRDAMQDARRAV